MKILKCLTAPALIASLTLTLTGGASFAATLIQENFDSYGATNSALNSLNGGTGFTGAWTDAGAGVRPGYRAGTNLTYTATGYINTGLTGSNSGSGFSNGRLAGNIGPDYTGRATGATVDSTPVWFSYLVNYTAAQATNDRAYVGFGSDAASLFNPNNNVFSLGFDGQNGDFRVFSGAGAGVFAGTPIVGTNLVIGNYSSSAFNIWINPTNVSTIGDLGAATITGAPSLAPSGTQFSRISVVFREALVSNPISIDSIRVGYNGTSSAANFSAVIPEPSTYALLGLGLGALLFLRRRNAKS